MRWFALFFIGLFIGVLCSSLAISVMGQRKQYPLALMRVMDVQLRQLAPQRDRQCQVQHLAQAETLIRLLGQQIPKAFPALPEIDKYTERFLDGDLSLRCVALAADLQRIADGCDDCHRHYR